MAIYKGQLMNQETKDILYPQTSTDMVDGLEELLEQGVMVADTLPIGSVIGWDSEEPYPSDIYEEVNYNPIQHIINPNFQVNQRGQESYTSNDENHLYTLDMWYILTCGSTLTLTKTSNGIHLNNVGTQDGILAQGTDIDLGTYQFVVKIRNATVPIYVEIYDSSGRFINTQISNGVNVVEIKDKKPVYISIVCRGNGEVDVEYIDLFEGDIVYPHVKEDEATALMRCQRKVYKGVLYALPYGISSGTQYWFQGVTNFPIEMDDNPTITYLNINVANIGTLTSDKIISIQNSKKYLGKVMKVDVGMQIEDNSYIRNPMLIDFIASCEPL